jgi:hypothetical protein
MVKAYEIPRKRMFGNLRMLDRTILPRRVPACELREGMSASHLARIRMLPCCVTGEIDGVEAHHLKSGPAARERAFGRRSADWWAVPLHWRAHWRLEKLPSTYERGWFAQYAVNPHTLAQNLWAASRDGDPDSVPDMLDVLRRHMDAAAEVLARARAEGRMLP